MKILSINPGHDGSVVYIRDGELQFSIEAEKDSHQRFSPITAQLVLSSLQMIDDFPDVVALGGWHKHLPNFDGSIGEGYHGLQPGRVSSTAIFGRDVTLFSSSHERSHLFMAAGMHPMAPLSDCVILVWEGTFGAFYRWERFGGVISRRPVLSHPGAKYAALFALADPTFSDGQLYPRPQDAGKLMALAAFGDASDCTGDERATVEYLLGLHGVYPFEKRRLELSPLFNCGVDTPRFWHAAKYISQRILDTFMHVAEESYGGLGLSLLISGGCGLNCDWNESWRRSGIFADVFVPPCSNDSGSAIGTGLDARASLGEPCQLIWSVFSGSDFEHDVLPEAQLWRSAALDTSQIAERLDNGDVVAWVQGRAEIGPRALGHRSLLASSLDSRLKVRLNEIKGREGYRPIAPCCREEDVRLWFEMALPDPFMLYFADVATDRIPAVTHVDGTSRVQAVRAADNPRLHELLGVFAERTGVGVLCNTSLNFGGRGFINRMSDLIRFCDDRLIDTFVVDGTQFSRVTPRPALS